MNDALCTHIFDIYGHVDSTSLNSNYSMKMSVGILSHGILSVGILSVGIMSVGLLSLRILSINQILGCRAYFIGYYYLFGV